MTRQKSFKTQVRARMGGWFDQAPFIRDFRDSGGAAPWAYALQRVHHASARKDPEL
ncbi:MAG TPA: hypothetical protein VFD59_02220 [Nocardioidaceae bacterium]|nr:hypothetical protein [Nocardioidaceae bacterium]